MEFLVYANFESSKSYAGLEVIPKDNIWEYILPIKTPKILLYFGNNPPFMLVRTPNVEGDSDKSLQGEVYLTS